MKDMDMPPMCMVMQNGFQLANEFSTSCIVFLFKGWDIDNNGKYAAAILGTFLLAFSSEGFTYARFLLGNHWKFPSGPPSASPALIRQFVLSFLYGLHMVLAYFLMLLVMNYETSLFIALIFGLSIGHFFFSWRKNEWIFHYGRGKSLAHQGIATTTSGEKFLQSDSLVEDYGSSHTPCCGGVGEF